MFLFAVRRSLMRRPLFLVLSTFALLTGYASAYPSAGPSVQFLPPINTVAGSGISAETGDGGAATSASLSLPRGAAIDSAGNVYVADTAGNRIRKIDTAGKISTIAGTGTFGWSGDGGPAMSAQLGNPMDVAVDAAGNIYIADTNNYRVRKVDAVSGVITTVAGTSSNCTAAGDGGLATAAQLCDPIGIDVDANGNLYIADTDTNRIRKVNPSGIITTIAGNGSHGFSGDGGPATAAMLAQPFDVTHDAAGNLYIADTVNERIRKVDTTGIITTVVGNGVSGYSGDGGLATAASIYYPFGVAVDAAGNIYIADTENYRIRRVDSNGVITTFAGTGSYGFSGDGGPATQAMLGNPFHIAVDTKGNLYIADGSYYRLREVTGSPTTTSFTTTAVGQSLVKSIAVQVNRDTVLKSINLGAGFNTSLMPNFEIGTVTGCVVDGATVTTAGTVCTVSVTFHPRFPGHLTAPLAFTDSTGLQTNLELEGDATGSLLAYTPGSSMSIPMSGGDTPVATPIGLAFSSADKLYIADSGNNRVLATNSGDLSVVDTGAISLVGPRGVAVDALDNLYILNSDSSGIVKVTPSGQATSIPVNVAGTGLSSPWGITVAESGDIYIADTGNQRILKLNAQGAGTIVSTGTYTLSDPRGVAVDQNGNLFIGDTFNNRVLKVSANGVASVVSTGSITLGRAGAVTVDPVGNLYILDGSGQIVEVATDGTVLPIPTGSFTLQSSYGIAFRKGFLFATDTYNNVLGEVSLTNPATVTFSDTVVGHTSSDGTKTVSVQNIGNQLLTFATPATGTNPSYPDNFPQDGNALQLCAAGTTLNPGSFCNIAVTFKPTVAGSNSGNVAFTDDMLNLPSSAQSIPLSGTALASLDHLTVTGAPVNADAGTAFNVTVTAADSSGGAVTDYTGTVHFKSNDAVAGLPADYTFTAADHGVHIFQVTLKTVGSQTITVYDTSNFGVMGDAVVQVNPGTPTDLTITGGQGQSATIGGRFLNSLDVLLKDQYGNPVPNVSVTFTSPSTGAGLYVSSSTRTSDYTGKASLYTLANGTAGSYQVVATAAGVSSPVTFNLTNTPGTTTTALAATPTSGATYGQSITLTATVTTQGSINPTIARSPAQPRMADSVPVGPATGTVTFYDGTRVVGTANLGGDAVVVGSSRGGIVAHTLLSNQGTSATASVTVNAPLGGDHSYTAVYAGDTNFGGSQTAAVAVAVGPTAATLMGPATQPVTIGSGQSASITVTVAAQSGATGLVAPTGTISYQIGSNGVQQAQVTNGQATLQVPGTLAVGNYSIQATYSGDSNYQAVATPTTIQLSVISTIPPDFSLTANPTSLTIKAGETGHATFTLTPVGGFTGTVTFSCDNLPAGVTCTFAPATLTADGSNTPLTSQLTITTQRLVGANLYLPGALLGILLFWQRRRFNLRTAQVLMLVLGAAVIAGMVGCGSSSTPTPQSNASTTSVTVTAKATGGSGGTMSHTATFNLNITD